MLDLNFHIASNVPKIGMLENKLSLALDDTWSDPEVTMKLDRIEAVYRKSRVDSSPTQAPTQCAM